MLNRYFIKNKEILAFFIKLLKSLDSLIFSLVTRASKTKGKVWNQFRDTGYLIISRIIKTIKLKVKILT